MAAQLRKRPPPSSSSPSFDHSSSSSSDPTAAATTSNNDPSPITHPSGRAKKSRATQLMRGISFVTYFLVCCVACVSLFLGPPK